MGRLVLLALVLCAAAAAVIVASGGVERDPAQQAEIDREAAAPRPVPKEEDPIPPAPRTRPIVQPEQGRLGATVVMDRLHFGTRRVRVRAGESVRWVNRDRVAHDVLADDAGGAGSPSSFASGRLAPGRSYRTTFPVRGTVRYVCVLHPTSMVAEVVVGPAR